MVDVSRVWLTGGDQVLERHDLERLFPHKEIALLPNQAIIKDGACELVLEPEHFLKYCQGYDWAFPAHWLAELGAQTTGLHTMVLLVRRIGVEAFEYCVPSFNQFGRWDRRPLNPDCELFVPIRATSYIDGLKFDIKMGTVVAVADVLFQHGEKTTFLRGIELSIKKENLI